MNTESLDDIQIKIYDKINDRGLKYAFITIREKMVKLDNDRKRIEKGWIRKINNITKATGLAK